jgi:hypothetical protein
MFTLQKMCPITSVDSFYDEESNVLKIIIGDEMGSVRIQDASALFDHVDLKPIDVVTGNLKRNPWRIFKFKESVITEDIVDERQVEAALEEGIFKQVAQWKAHKDSIKFIKYINQTDTPVIFTAGLDRMAKIWNLKGELMGTLRQGVMRVPDKPWNFPLLNHEGHTATRNDKVSKMLEDVKHKRDQDMQARKMFTRANEKKKGTSTRPGDRTSQPVVSSLGKNFTKELDYSAISNKWYAGDFGDTDRDGGEDHSSKVKRLLETVKRMTKETAQANMDRNAIEEEEEKQNLRKIGPFQFDIDHDIDAEVLNNEEVFKDLKELDEKIIKQDKSHSYLFTKSFGRKKKKNKYY